MNRIIPLILALALGPTATVAQAMQEKFIVPTYPGETPWKPHIVRRPLNEMIWVEWWPENQPQNAIRDIVTEQIIFVAKNVKPAAFVTSMFAGINQNCTGAKINGPTEQTENGHPVAYGQLYCVGQKSAGQDVDVFVKAIGGTDALYLVQREFRRPATPGATPGFRHFSGSDAAAELKADMDAKSVANQYLNDVRLCPSAEPCPPAALAPKP